MLKYHVSMYKYPGVQEAAELALRTAQQKNFKAQLQTASCKNKNFTKILLFLRTNDGENFIANIPIYQYKYKYTNLFMYMYAIKSKGQVKI